MNQRMGQGDATVSVRALWNLDRRYLQSVQHFTAEQLVRTFGDLLVKYFKALRQRFLRYQLLRHEGQRFLGRFFRDLSCLRLFLLLCGFELCLALVCGRYGNGWLLLDPFLLRSIPLCWWLIFLHVWFGRHRRLFGRFLRAFSFLPEWFGHDDGSGGCGGSRLCGFRRLDRFRFGHLVCFALH
uniref:Uncharacterized protein n=1 Tax=Anopheles dirus TaxID=7168 RepID=A0A182NXX7_9DIPT